MSSRWPSKLARGRLTTPACLALLQVSGFASVQLDDGQDAHPTLHRETVGDFGWSRSIPKRLH